jgi:Uma2 family endonuclease
MAEAARRRMTVDEYLVWDDGTGRRYELVAGEIVAMAPPSEAHSVLVGALVHEIAKTLKPPCRVGGEVGIPLAHRRDAYFQADVAATCRPPEHGTVGMAEPLVVVEVLSKSTEQHDRKVKLPDYRRIASLREIVLIDSERLYCEVHRRKDDGTWQVDIMVEPNERLALNSVGLDVALSTLYANIALAEPDRATG